MACTITGAEYFFAWASAASSAAISCPSTGPRYLISRLEYSAELLVNRLRNPCKPPRTPRYIARAGPPRRSNNLRLDRWSSRYDWRVLTSFRNRAIPPIVGAYDRPLSLTTITRFRLLSSLMLFSASQVIPPVSDPSPTTATTCRSSWPVICKAREMPSAHDSELDAWELSTTSCADSERCG